MKMPNPGTRKGKVLALLMEGEWISTMDINDVTVGGSEGCKRLRELRQDGWPIIQQYHAKGSQSLYRLDVHTLKEMV
jgi:hypothetical protein